MVGEKLLDDLNILASSQCAVLSAMVGRAKKNQLF
jgi:hypothetical protein